MRISHNPGLELTHEADILKPERLCLLCLPAKR